MSRSFLQLLVVVILVAGAVYYFSPRFEPRLEANASERAPPKTYLVNTRSWNYSEEGSLTEVLEADRATFFASRSESLLESPRLYSHNLNDETWSASSKTGRYEGRRNLLTLTDSVVLRNDTNEVELATREMIINLQKNTARSVVPVTVSNGRSRTTADGMFADLEAQTVRLNHNVQSVYNPPTPAHGIRNE